jgi:hypothetical protein
VTPKILLGATIFRGVKIIELLGKKCRAKVLTHNRPLLDPIILPNIAKIEAFIKAIVAFHLGLCISYVLLGSLPIPAEFFLAGEHWVYNFVGRCLDPFTVSTCFMLLGVNVGSAVKNIASGPVGRHCS